jgi:hypothetical protein
MYINIYINKKNTSKCIQTISITKKSIVVRHKGVIGCYTTGWSSEIYMKEH